MWNLETGADAFTVRAGPTFPHQPWMDLAWNHAGNRLAIATNDGLTGRVTIVDRAGRQAAALQEDYGIAVGSVAFSRDGRRLITTRLPTVESEADDGQVVIWDWREAEVERAINTPARHAVLSPTSDLVANDTQTQARYWGDTVQIWNPATGRACPPWPGTPRGCGTSPSAPTGRGSPPPASMAPCGSGSRGPVSRFRSCAGTAARSPGRFSPDGSRLATVGGRERYECGRSIWTTSSRSPSTS